jgi:hypothetical protein
MRLEVPREFDRLGAVRIDRLQKIDEIDAGAESEISDQNHAVVRSLPAKALSGVQREMAIVVPVKSERLKLIQTSSPASPIPASSSSSPTAHANRSTAASSNRNRSPTPVGSSENKGSLCASATPSSAPRSPRRATPSSSTTPAACTPAQPGAG